MERGDGWGPVLHCRCGRGIGAAMTGLFFAVLMPFLSGCAPIAADDKGANQSLVEIGELSLEEGESLENLGNKTEANKSYRKALWAFRYHEKLTGEQPFLMEEALDGVDRTSGPKR